MTKSTEVIWGLECVPYASLPSKLYHQHILDSLTWWLIQGARSDEAPYSCGS